MNLPFSRTLCVCAAAATVVVMTATGVSAAAPSPSGAEAAAFAEAASPPVPMPANPQGMPAPTRPGNALDAFAGYQGQSACASTPSPGIVQLRALALQTYARGGTSPAYARSCASGGTSEHKDGRAWDWMLSYSNLADRKAAADFLSWLTGPGPSGVRGEMAARLGIMYVIFNHRSWSSYNREWSTYTGYDPHTSHIHISLSWNGARAHTSFWTGKVWATDYGPCQVFTSQPAVAPTNVARTQPCVGAVMSPRRSTLPFSWLGGGGDAVAAAQRSLRIPVTRLFDVATQRAVLQFQRNHDLPRTGALDKPTWASLQPASARLNVPDWTPREALAWAQGDAGSPTLHRASAGKSVYALQVALELPDQWRTGFFGRRTANTVIARQNAAGQTATSRVDSEFWSLLANR